MEIPRLLENVDKGLFVCIDNNFYNKQTADHIYELLQEQITYDKNSVVILYGKPIAIPRKQTAFGDPGLSYKFSGTTVPAKPWIPLLLKIKKDVENISGKQFNFCLVNYYADGTRYIGYHSDDEKDLGEYPCIASVSFGVERKFYFKSYDSSEPVVKTKLNHGCLCLMMHPTNQFWKHSVPKELKIKEPRINLTFRCIEPKN